MPVDPVLLRSGQEVPGDQRFTMEYDGTIYVFSTQRTLDTFRADPATYAAQQGGACGRMGPLGGLGDARRYAIQDNMLYFFASEECRRTFRENPKLYMEPRDIFPSGTPEQQTLGLAAIDRWVAWAGGKDAVKAATSFKHVSKKRVEQGSAEWDLTETLEIEGPRSMQRVTSGRRSMASRTRCGGTRFTPPRTAPPSRGTWAIPTRSRIRGACRSSAP